MTCMDGNTSKSELDTSQATNQYIPHSFNQELVIKTFSPALRAPGGTYNYNMNGSEKWTGTAG